MTTRSAALLTLALALAACTPDPEPPSPRVVVVGVDAADWQVLDKLIADGSLPTFAKLKSEGAWGTLMSHEPIFSPAVWATISTGKLPDKHGISSFTAEFEGQTVPVTSNLLRADRVWDILGRYDKTVGVIGWWTTWPATKVNGFMISERAWPMTFGADGWPVTSEDGPGVSHRTYPESLFAQIEPSIVTRNEFTPAQLSVVDVTGPLATLHGLGPSTADTYAKDITFAQLTHELYPKVHPDFFSVYYELTDVMAHYFWDFWRYYRHASQAEPTTFQDPPHGQSPEIAARIGQNYEGAYRFVDGALADLISQVDEYTTVIVVSDHGYDDNPDHRTMHVGDDRHEARPHWHRLDGVILAWGYGVKPGKIPDAQVADVTPTILYAMGVPVGADMDGEPLLDLFIPAFRSREVETIPTHEIGTRDAATPLPSPDDSTHIEFLKSLGYIGD